MIKILFAAGILVFTVACQKKSESFYQPSEQMAHILGGEAVQAGDAVALSTVALKYDHYALCTGTLISPNLVLTASHCLAEEGTKEHVRVAFALNVADHQGEVLYEIAEYALHPQYTQYKPENDVALIVLKKPAPETYKPVAMLSQAFELQVGMPMLLAGYGVVNDITGEDTETLRKVTVPIAKVLETIVVTDQTQNSGACNGDSGGPAYLEKNGTLYVYGITRGPHDGAVDCHHYGEYTYASKFEDFIVSKATELKAELPVFVNPTQ